MTAFQPTAFQSDAFQIRAEGVAAPVQPSGPSPWRPFLTRSRLGKQRPWWGRHYQRRMKGHA